MYYITKKEKRYRYIGFIIKKYNKNFNIKKYEIINEIKKKCKTLFNKDMREMDIFLIRFNGKKGIVKCNHLEKDNTIQILNSIKKIYTHDIKLKTIGTSGTIKTLINKHINN